MEEGLQEKTLDSYNKKERKLNIHQGYCYGAFVMDEELK